MGTETDPRERLRWRPIDEPDGQATLFSGPQDRVTHPEFHDLEFIHVGAKSLINTLPPGSLLPFRHTINVYRGCSHACLYCFARPTHEYLNLDAGRDFERVIVVKVNAVELVRHELHPSRWAGEHVAMGTNTDPYQRCEGRYRLTRGVIEALVERDNPFSILTKSALVLRDLDLITEANRHADISVSFSVGTLDTDVWRSTEPGTPHPRRRIEAVAVLREAGIESGVLIAPVIPGVSDQRDQLAEVVRAAVDAGATSITPILLHLRPGVKEQFMPWIADELPDLLPTYERMYPGSYAPAQERRRITRVVRELVDEFGGTTAHRSRGTRRPPARSETGRDVATADAGGHEQLRLSM